MLESGKTMSNRDTVNYTSLMVTSTLEILSKASDRVLEYSMAKKKNTPTRANGTETTSTGRES